MATFERVNLAPAEWGATLSAFPDAIVYQSPAWLSFLAETQKGEPVLAVLKEGDQALGYFSGLVVKKMGLRILGSPFRAWTCPYMGLNLLPSVSRRVAAAALPAFAFRELGCHHFEMVDFRMTLDDTQGLDLNQEARATYVVDLAQSEEVLLANMNSYRRRDIRRAEKHGVIIEEAQDPAFADEFSEQLKDVFAKQGLVPTFGVERVRALVKHLAPTGMLLRLRARDPAGHCIATGLYLGMQSAAFYWGGASWRQYQNLHPNELLQWYAMCHWKNRGMKTYDLVGTMDFKARFGGSQVTTYMISQSKWRFLSLLRTWAPAVFRTGSRLVWKAKSLARGKPAAGLI
jgi:hypothetical protein